MLIWKETAQRRASRIYKKAQKPHPPHPRGGWRGRRSTGICRPPYGSVLRAIALRARQLVLKCRAGGRRTGAMVSVICSEPLAGKGPRNIGSSFSGPQDVCVIAVVIAACWTVGSTAPAQQAGSARKRNAEPASNPDQELGRRFLIKPENLPLPKSGPIAASRSLVVPYAGQAPRVMEGFTATPFITGLEHPRRLLVLPNNDVIVAEQKTGY